jgi:hypothetical protein
MSGSKEMQKAAKDGDLAVIYKLFDEGVRWDGWCSIIAVQNNHKHILKILLQDIQDKYERNKLFYDSLYSYSLDCVAYLHSEGTELREDTFSFISKGDAHQLKYDMDDVCTRDFLFKFKNEFRDSYLYEQVTAKQQEILNTLLTCKDMIATDIITNVIYPYF